jgi:hypothetical protein
MNVGVLRKTDICEKFKYRYYTPSHRDDIFITADFNRREVIFKLFPLSRSDDTLFSDAVTT